MSTQSEYPPANEMMPYDEPEWDQTTLLRAMDVARRKCPRDMPIWDRISRRIGEPIGPNGCMPWVGSRDEAGYGTIGIPGGSSCAKVSRIICKHIHGPAPDDKPLAGHWCGNKYCVNPRHIRWVSVAENFADRRRHKSPLKGQSK